MTDTRNEIAPNPQKFNVATGLQLKSGVHSRAGGVFERWIPEGLQKKYWTKLVALCMIEMLLQMICSSAATPKTNGACPANFGEATGRPLATTVSQLATASHYRRRRVQRQEDVYALSALVLESMSRESCLLAEIPDFGCVYDCGECGCIHVRVGPLSVRFSPQAYMQLVALIHTSAANFETWLHERQDAPEACEEGGDA